MSSSRFAPYRNALAAISTRTGAPLPSLIFSFAVLHELTAIVPLVGIFYAARGLQVGERVVNRFVHGDYPDAGTQAEWVSRRVSQWVDEGEIWANRVGRRYGVFGFEKGMPSDRVVGQRSSRQLAGDVANAVLAYGATKVSVLGTITGSHRSIAVPVTSLFESDSGTHPSQNHPTIPSHVKYEQPGLPPSEPEALTIGRATSQIFAPLIYDVPLAMISPANSRSDLADSSFGATYWFG